MDGSADWWGVVLGLLIAAVVVTYMLAAVVVLAGIATFLAVLGFFLILPGILRGLSGRGL